MPAKKTKRKASATRRRKPAKTGLPGWALVIGGLLVGGLLVLLVQFVVQRTTAPDSGLRHAWQSPEKTQVKPKPRPAPTTTPAVSEKPKYDFYTILPEVETIIPEPDSRDRKTAVSSRPEPGTSYILQAASYNSFEDADRLKAQLTLNGMQPQIQKINIPNKGEYYRVRLGPFENLERLDAINQQLKGMGLTALRLKVKDQK